VSLDGRSLPLNELIDEVTAVVGSYGWGRIDMVENRRVGIKSREIYECPGALALLMAHSDLEDLTLERDLAHEKARLEPRYADLVYDGLWFSPLKQALDAFVDESQRFVTGEVRLRCEIPGRCIVAGRRSEVGLYDYELATYEAADRFHHEDSAGFVRLWGLGVETWAARQNVREAD
jgi:argininosuccinate synthase